VLYAETHIQFAQTAALAAISRVGRVGEINMQHINALLMCRVDSAWKILAQEPVKRAVTIIKFSKETIAREQRLQR
jgi:hypothetical protein